MALKASLSGKDVFSKLLANCFGKSLDLTSVSSVFPCTERKHTRSIRSPFVRHFPFTYVFYGLFSPHGCVKPIQGVWKTSYLACRVSGSNHIHEVQSSFSSKSSSLCLEVSADALEEEALLKSLVGGKLSQLLLINWVRTLMFSLVFCNRVF